MHHDFIHQSRWLFLSVLLFSLQVSATHCKLCSKESEPGKDGQMFCQTCDSGKSASPPHDPPSFSDEGLKSSAAEKKATEATNDEIPAQDKTNILEFRELWKELMDSWAPLQAQPEMMQRLHQAELSAGATETERMPIHEKVRALIRKRHSKENRFKSSNMSYMKKVYLLSVGFQNSQLAMDPASVFQVIQRGDMIQLSISAQMVAADAGNQVAAAATTRLLEIHGAIIPDPATEGDAESTDMHLFIGTQQPLRVNQQNLMSVLTATMEVVAENSHNNDASLHFHLIPQTSIPPDEDPLLPSSNIEDWINRNLPDSGSATDQL